MGPGYVSKETTFGMMTLKKEERVGRKVLFGGHRELRGSLWLAPQTGVPKPFQPIRRLEEIR